MNLRRLLTGIVTAVAVSSPMAGAYASAPTLPPAVQEETETLAHSPVAAPGAEFINMTQSTACSVGWVARDTATNDRGFITAGHCGEAGDVVALRDGEGYREIGHVVWTAYNDSMAAMEDIDVAFVKVNSSSDLSPQVIGYSKAPSRLMDAPTYKRVLPDLCKVGQTTGTTCGDSQSSQPYTQRAVFFAKNYNGDSGSPVFAQTKSGEIIAVGVLAGNTGVNSEKSTAQIITPEFQNRYNFEILTQ